MMMDSVNARCMTDKDGRVLKMWWELCDLMDTMNIQLESTVETYPTEEIYRENQECGITEQKTDGVKGNKIFRPS